MTKGGEKEEDRATAPEHGEKGKKKGMGKKKMTDNVL